MGEEMAATVAVWVGRSLDRPEECCRDLRRTETGVWIKVGYRHFARKV